MTNPNKNREQNSYLKFIFIVIGGKKKLREEC